MDFAVLVKYQFEGEPVSSVLLGAVDSIGVGATASMTKQPMVDGDEISDHMFRQGKTVTVNGSCSLNGDDGIVLSGGKSKLANLQELFERIQSEGIMCDIFKISTKNEEDIRFLQRTNMVLDSIQWVENINSLDYGFSFTQALLADVVQYDMDPNDTSLPNPSGPITSSFTDKLMDWKQVDRMLIEILKNEELIEQEFLNYVAGRLGTAGAQVLIIGVSVGILVGVITAVVSSGPVGWVVGAVVGIAYIIGKAISDCVKKRKELDNYKIQAFRYYDNEQKDDEEYKRFLNFIKEVHNAISSINKLFHIYQLSVDEKTECMITIGSDYYCFLFSDKNPNNGSRSVIVYDAYNQTEVGSNANISSCITDIGQANNKNRLFLAKNNANVYIMNPSDDKSKLTNYYIVVCDFDPTKYVEIIEEILKYELFK